MRALLSTIGSRGDVQPLVALALQLKALGHAPHLCVPPDFREWIEGFGLTVTPVGPEVRRAAPVRAQSAPAPFSPELRRQMAEGTVATQFTTVAEAARECDIIVGATALQIAARSIAETMAVPYVFAAYSPTVLPSLHHPPPPLPPLPGEVAPATTDNTELWARDTARFNDLFRNALNTHRTGLGLAPVDDVRNFMFTDQPWLAADPTLGPWPDSTDDGVFHTGAWILEDARSLPRELEAFLDAGDPPVFFGFGSTRAPQDVAGVMVETARALGRRAVISGGWADLSAADSRPDCLTIGDVNLLALFPRVAAAVHHGGAGTTTAVALAGIPHVIVPQAYDQHYWARRVEALGIGIAHATGAPTTESLTAALARALESSVAARAKSIAPAVRRDGARIAAERLASMTS